LTTTILRQIMKLTLHCEKSYSLDIMYKVKRRWQ
jgi:hypothetical protein